MGIRLRRHGVVAMCASFVLAAGLFTLTACGVQESTGQQGDTNTAATDVAENTVAPAVAIDISENIQVVHKANITQGTGTYIEYGRYTEKGFPRSFQYYEVKDGKEQLVMSYNLGYDDNGAPNYISFLTADGITGGGDMDVASSEGDGQTVYTSTLNLEDTDSVSIPSNFEQSTTISDQGYYEAFALKATYKDGDKTIIQSDSSSFDKYGRIVSFDQDTTVNGVEDKDRTVSGTVSYMSSNGSEIARVTKGDGSTLDFTLTYNKDGYLESAKAQDNSYTVEFTYQSLEDAIEQAKYLAETEAYTWLFPQAMLQPGTFFFTG